MGRGRGGDGGEEKGKKQGRERRGQGGEREESAFVLASHPPSQYRRATVMQIVTPPRSLSHPPLLALGL